MIAKESPAGLKGSFRSIKGDVKQWWICEEETGMNTAWQCLHPPPPAIKTNIIAPLAFPPPATAQSNTVTKWLGTLQHTNADDTAILTSASELNVVDSREKKLISLGHGKMPNRLFKGPLKRNFLHLDLSVIKCVAYLETPTTFYFSRTVSG